MTESHSDDITTLKFHESKKQLLSGSTDGLVCVYELDTLTDDDVVQIIKFDSISTCGFIGSDYIYATSHMESMGVWSIDGDVVG